MKFPSQKNCYHFRTLRKNNSVFWDLFSNVIRTAFYVSMGTFWGDSFVFEKEFFHQFRTLSEQFLAFCTKLSDRVFETAKLRCTDLLELFDSNFFPWRKFSVSFSDIELKLLGFSSEFFGRIVKTAINVTIGTIWGDWFVSGIRGGSPFLDIERKIFGLLPIIPWRGCPNCILRDAINILRAFLL